MPPSTTTTNTTTRGAPKELTLPPSNPTDLTLFFKHTVHTILLLVSPSTPFTTILSTLLLVLRERYPDGLTPLPSSPSATLASKTKSQNDNEDDDEAMEEGNKNKGKIPLPDSIQSIYLAIPTDSYDRTKGWTELHLSLGDTPQSVGIKDAGVVAFRIEGEDEDVDGKGRGLEFDVCWPSYVDEYGEEEEGEE